MIFVCVTTHSTDVGISICDKQLSFHNQAEKFLNSDDDHRNHDDR